MDALEPSQGMLEILKQKNIYKNVLCEAYHPDKPLSIEKGLILYNF